jgi:hypothetical protein
MLEFQLFRIGIYFNNQIEIFDPKLSRIEILKNILDEKPSLTVLGKNWHIGNIYEIGDFAYYFRLGRTSKSTLEMFEEGNFIESEFETSPYTHVLLNTSLEVCAIAKKNKLSPSIKGIANRLINLFQVSTIISKNNINTEIKEIIDPKDFISYLRTSYAIKNFWVNISRPNAFDADEDFTKPIQSITNEIEARETRIELKGNYLNYLKLESITRSAASTGNKVGATIQQESNGTLKRIKLEGNNIILEVDNKIFEDDKYKFMNNLINYYKQIKNE